jgi:hypothetical protein
VETSPAIRTKKKKTEWLMTNSKRPKLPEGGKSIIQFEEPHCHFYQGSNISPALLLLKFQVFAWYLGKCMVKVVPSPS